MANLDYQAQFDIASQVPERAELTAGWARDAKAYRAEARMERDLGYGDDPRQKLDVFLPEGESKGAPVLFIHGGYWQYYDRSSFSHAARGLNAQGRSVVIPDYSQAPGKTVRAIVEELREACIWTWQRFGQRPVVVGHSAGGHMAASMLVTDWAARGQPADLVRSAVAFSGLFDLQPLTMSTLNNGLGLTLEEAKAISPLYAAPPMGKSCDVIVGARESDEYRRQSAEIAKLWSQAAVAMRHQEAEGANHLTVIAPLADPNAAIVKRISELADI